AHARSPPAQLLLPPRAYGGVAPGLPGLAPAAAGGHWVATGGGGYQWARVVPRAWTIAFAEMCDADVPDELPEAWIEEAELRLGAEVPATLSEPGLGPGPGDEGARAVVRALDGILSA